MRIVHDDVRFVSSERRRFVTSGHAIARYYDVEYTILNVEPMLVEHFICRRVSR